MTVDTIDIEVVLGRDLTTAEETRVARLTEMAEGLVTAQLRGFQIGTGSETVDVFPGDPDVLFTPKYPVTAVNSIELNGTLVNADVYQWTDKGKIVFSAWPLLDRFDVDPLSLGPTVTVDYDFGFDPLPNDIALTVAAMVAAALLRQRNDGGVQSESLGAYSVSYGDWAVQEAAQGMTFPAGALGYWRRTGLMSVPLVRYR